MTQSLVLEVVETVNTNKRCIPFKVISLLSLLMLLLLTLVWSLVTQQLQVEWLLTSPPNIDNIYTLFGFTHYFVCEHSILGTFPSSVSKMYTWRPTQYMFFPDFCDFVHKIQESTECTVLAHIGVRVQTKKDVYHNQSQNHYLNTVFLNTLHSEVLLFN